MIRIGMIGTGHGLRSLKPGFEYTGKAKVVAVSGSSGARAREAAAANSIEIACASAAELCNLTEIDMVCVASPNSYHLEHARLALQTSKHVYLEKPIGISVCEAREVLDAMNEGDQRRHVFVGHQLRFNPFIQEIVERIKNGELGRVYSVTIGQRGRAFASDRRPWTWEFESKSGGGVRLAMATHLLDLSNYIAQSTPKHLSISADPVHLTRRPGGEGERPVSVSNFCSLDVDYGQAFAQLSTSAAAHLEGYFNLEVLGNHGGATYDGVDKLQFYRDGSLVDEPKIGVLAEDYAKRPGSSVFRKSVTYFADSIVAVLRGESPSTGETHSVQDAVELMSLLDGSYSEFQRRLGMNREAF